MALKLDFDTLWKNYPAGFSHNPNVDPGEDAAHIHALNQALKKKLGGQVNNPAFTNLCVIRLSLAMNKAGLEIPKTTFLKWYGRNFHVVKDAAGNYYGHGVLEMYHYLTEKYGKPDLELKKAEMEEDPAVAKALQGRHGILFFKVDIWNDASGHMTLWNGKACADNPYFLEANKVALWDVKKPVPAPQPQPRPRQTASASAAASRSDAQGGVSAA